MHILEQESPHLTVLYKHIVTKINSLGTVQNFGSFFKTDIYINMQDRHIENGTTTDPEGMV